MAFELHRNQFPALAASAINAGAAVILDTGDVQRQVVPVATNLPVGTTMPFGVGLATAVNPGDGIDVFDGHVGNVVKVLALASLGHGAQVGVIATAAASAGYGPLTASGFWSIGRSVTAANAGEIFSLYVSPRQLP